MDVDVLGAGSAFSTQFNTSSILLKDTCGLSMLIDCGPTIPRALWQRGIGVHDIHALYLTHCHPDHCAGIPALFNQWKSFGRQQPLDIFCQASQQAVVQALIQAAHWPKPNLPFEIHWHDIPAQFSWHHWHCQSALSQHSMPCRGLRLDTGQVALFYSGDGRPTEHSIHCMAGCQAVFQECFSAHALPSHSNHGDLPNCLALRQRVTFDHLYLYHFADDQYSTLSAKIPPQADTSVLVDGMRIPLSLRTG